jgi:molybdopterin-guanine dinucleotide biosynthesis protein A
MGGGKPGRVLAGRPLVAHVADALAAVCDQVVVVAKADSELPALPGVERWDEPPEPRHPAAGIAYALERAGAPLLVCAADMPFVTAAACRALIEAAGPAVAVTEGRLQPLLAVYEPAAARALRAAAEAGEPLTRAVERLAPLRVELPAALVRSVDTPEDLDSAG